MLDPDFARGREAVWLIERRGRYVNRIGTVVMLIRERCAAGCAERSHDMR
jgi:hypothetical protein